ncbi:hypothetical protein [Bacteriophage sp.]|nr:hypothetical protein [Bacteriophage sp.]
MEPRDFKRISAFPRFPSPLRKETAEMGFRRLFYTPPPSPMGISARHDVRPRAFFGYSNIPLIYHIHHYAHLCQYPPELKMLVQFLEGLGRAVTEDVF